MKVVVAPDSFKGSLTAVQVVDTIESALRLVISDIEVSGLPMADGGEGTVDSITQATGGRIVFATATGPLGEKARSSYGVSGNGRTAIIEMARIAGLPMIPLALRNPFRTTSFGVGEMIQHALDGGYRDFVVGLGGSATNDGGLGMLQALGAEFFDTNGVPVQGNGQGLASIEHIRLDRLDKRVMESRIQIACDVQNILCGPEGASCVYGPQKGATPEQVAQLDKWMATYAKTMEHYIGRPLATVPGAGAAGGLGFAFLVLGAELVPGAALVANTCHLEDSVRMADWVITGEGRTDQQTWYGKVPFYVSQVAKQHQVSVALISGSIAQSVEGKLSAFFDKVRSVTNHRVSEADSIQHPRERLYDAAVQMAWDIK
jgi:glycerate kinase